MWKCIAYFVYLAHEQLFTLLSCVSDIWFIELGRKLIITLALKWHFIVSGQETGSPPTIEEVITMFASLTPLQQDEDDDYSGFSDDTGNDHDDDDDDSG